jgi:hydrogenase maturation protease
MNENDAYIRRPVLVLGIGNILLHDEGIGVYVVERMQKGGVPDYVEFLDGGTAGADLLDHICDRQKVIVVDAVDVDSTNSPQADIEPGTILRFTSDCLASNTGQSISLHEFGIADTLAMARRLNCAPHEVIIIGIKPKDITPGLGLSEKIAGVVPRIIECVSADTELCDEPASAIESAKPAFVKKA